REIFIFRGDVGGGEEYHRQVAGGGVDAQVVDQAEPVHDRHEDVRDDQRGVFLLNGIQRFLPVTRGDHSISFEGQRSFQQVEDVGDVVHDEDVTRRGHALIVPVGNNIDHTCSSPASRLNSARKGLPQGWA